MFLEFAVQQTKVIDPLRAVPVGRANPDRPGRVRRVAACYPKPSWRHRLLLSVALCLLSQAVAPSLFAMSLGNPYFQLTHPERGQITAVRNESGSYRIQAYDGERGLEFSCSIENPGVASYDELAQRWGGEILNEDGVPAAFRGPRAPFAEVPFQSSAGKKGRYPADAVRWVGGAKPGVKSRVVAFFGYAHKSKAEGQVGTFIVIQVGGEEFDEQLLSYARELAASFKLVNCEPPSQR